MADDSSLVSMLKQQAQLKDFEQAVRTHLQQLRQRQSPHAEIVAKHLESICALQLIVEVAVRGYGFNENRPVEQGLNHAQVIVSLRIAHTLANLALSF